MSHEQHPSIEQYRLAGHAIRLAGGEIHGQMNLSDTETAELIACQSVGSAEETGTIFVEDEWK